MATNSSILAWRIPWTEEPLRATVPRVAKNQTQVKCLSTHGHKCLSTCVHTMISLLRNSELRDDTLLPKFLWLIRHKSRIGNRIS